MITEEEEEEEEEDEEDEDDGEDYEDVEDEEEEGEEEGKHVVEDVARKRVGLRKTAGKRKPMIRKKIQAQEVQDELHAPPQHQARNEHRWRELMRKVFV